MTADIRQVPGFERANIEHMRRQLLVGLRGVTDLRSLSLLVVVVTPELTDVVPRSVLAGRLHDAGLHAQAREVATRRTAPGALLAWCETSVEAGFQVLPSAFVSAALRMRRPGARR